MVVLVCAQAAPVAAGFDESVRLARQGEFVAAFRRLVEPVGAAVKEGTCDALEATVPTLERGLASFEALIGDVYYFGHGVPKDYRGAIRWYRRAAEKGNALAQSTLGDIYYHGYGVPQNYVIAAKWWQLAASQGVGVAQLNLSVMYANGDGVPRDLIRSHVFANLAAARLAPGKDQEIAVSNRDLIAREMTSDQIAEAQSLAAKWRPGPLLQDFATERHVRKADAAAVAPNAEAAKPAPATATRRSSDSCRF